MNKKFSTLVAGILLAGSLPVAAQFCPVNGEVDYRTRLVNAAKLDPIFQDVKSINENYYYQLQVKVNGDDQLVLSVERDYSTGKLYLTAQPITKATLTHTLWQIKTPGREVNGRLFSYVNKETGFELTFDHNNAVQYTPTNSVEWNDKKNYPGNINWNYENRGLMDGCNNWWSWYTVEDQNTNALGFKKIYSYFHNADSVMYLKAVQNGSALFNRTYNDVYAGTTKIGRTLKNALTSTNGLDGTNNNGYAIVPIKQSAANAETWLQQQGDVLEIKPVVAGAKVLNAAQINSMIDADKSYLKFAAANDGIAGYDTWNEAANTDRNGKTTKFTVCKPGTKEVLSLATNPFNYTFRAIEALDPGLGLDPQTSNSQVTGYNILFETENPILTASNGDKQYGYLYVSEYPYEGQAFQGIYNGLEVKVAPFSYLKGTQLPYSKVVELRYPNADQLEAWRQSNDANDQALYTEYNDGAQDALQSRYFWKVTYYATNDSVVFEPYNASRMSQADATAGKKYEESNLASLTYGNFLNTVNAGVAYGNGSAATENTMFNKAAGVPVALYAMNFGPAFGDVASFLTVGYASGWTLDGADQVEASDDDFAAVKKTEDGNPAFVTNNAQGKQYHSAMELTMRFANNYSYLKRATVKDGVYFINLGEAGAATSLTENRVKGAYLVKDMKGHLVYDVAQDEQDFTHMPATQWVVEQKPCTVEGYINVNETPVVTIRNREFDDAEDVSFEGQLYQDAHGCLFTINHREYARKATQQTVDRHRYPIFSCADKMNFNKLAEVNTLGYFNEVEDVLRENTYQFQNMYDFGRYRFLGIDDLKAEMDTLKLLENGATEFELFTVKDWTPRKIMEEYIDNGVKKTRETGKYYFTYSDSVAYGYASDNAGAPQLWARLYKIKLKDKNLIDNDHKFVAINNQHKYVVAKESDIQNPANGLNFAVVALKENNHMEGEHCYSILNATSYNLVGDYTMAQLWDLRLFKNATDEFGNKYDFYYQDVDDNGSYDKNKDIIKVIENVDKTQLTGKLVVEGTTLDAKIADLCETTSSVFALVQANRPLYATLAGDYVNNLNKMLTLRTIDEQGNEYLYEDSHSAKAQRWNMNYLGVENRTEEGNEGFYVDFVAASEGSRMPQYLFAVAADSVPAYTWCNELLPSGQPKHGVNPSCGHDEEYAGYTEGRFLVNFNDSVKAALIDKQTNADKFKSDNYTRLGFKTAVHRGDSLFILNDGQNLNDYKVASEDAAENGRLYIVPTFFSKDNEGADKVWTAVKLDGTHNNVAFALRNTDDEEQSVMIESNSTWGDSQIGSFSGAWIKIINNVPVLAQYYNNNGNHNTGDSTDSWKGDMDEESATTWGEFINQGARFLIGSVDKSSDATANEEVAAADVTVIATQGAIIVKGAAGKVITVANVLGQTIANQVAASDNVTIAAPAGIAVVTVDGEATKVVVK